MAVIVLSSFCVSQGCILVFCIDLDKDNKTEQNNVKENEIGWKTERVAKLKCSYTKSISQLANHRV
jgi:hypothetical protein